MMEKMRFLFYFLILSVPACLSGQVGINTTSPNPNAVLDINSEFGGGNYGGFLPPRVTLAERNLILVTSADDGMILYVTLPSGERCLQLFNGASLIWQDIRCFGIVSVPTTVFFESMGTVLGNTNVNNHHAVNGFDNSGTCVFFSNITQSQVRITIPSDAIFPSASGLGNVFFGGGLRDFIINNIDLSVYPSPLTLKLLIHKSTQASNGSEFTIEYFDGSTWTNISVNNLPTTAGSATWHERTLSTTVPNTIQSLRFTRPNLGPDFRIDDIEIISP